MKFIERSFHIIMVKWGLHHKLGQKLSKSGIHEWLNSKRGKCTNQLIFGGKKKRKAFVILLPFLSVPLFVCL